MRYIRRITYIGRFDVFRDLVFQSNFHLTPSSDQFNKGNIRHKCTNKFIDFKITLNVNSIGDILG